MNDRFKFRVWDSIDCEYTEDSDVIRLTQYGKFVFNNASNNTEPELNHKRFIFEQCTGLKDKNGRLIYEGDILRLCEATYPAVIYWDGTSWCAMVNGKRKDLWNEFSYRVCGIVGNIHENHELVKE